MEVNKDAESNDPWEYFRYFLGDWQGVGTGKIGESHLERKYKFILNEQFMQVYNRSVFKPQEKNPHGEIHEDMGIFSYDKSKGVFILREFHVEGYVNQYTVERQDVEGKIWVMTTDTIENIPSGWQARTTYKILNHDEFQETFELMRPGEDWTCYISSHLKRGQTV